MTKIEDYTDQKLQSRMEIVQDLIRDLQSANSITSQELMDEKRKALEKAQSHYNALAAERIRRTSAEIDALIEDIQ